MREFIQQVVSEIVFGVGELDPVRRRMFFVWLGNHASELKCEEDASDLENLPEKLTTWFDHMSLVSILWEYRTVMSEIEWWRGLTQAALDRQVGVKV
jgi:hypothetical protein